MNRKSVAGISTAGLLLAALAVLWPTTAAADTEFEPGWRLRFYAASIDFDNNATGASGRGSYDIDIGAAVGINAEYRFSRRLGIDVGALAGGGVDVAYRPVWFWDNQVSVYDTMSFTALSAGLDIHLTPDKKVDFYVCPMLAIVQYGGIVVDTRTPGTSVGVDFDEDLAFGGTLGVAVPFGDSQRWSFNAHLTYLDSALDGTGRDGFRLEQDYDTTMLGLGLGYRF